MNIDYKELAEKYGTPLYVYFTDIIKERIMNLKEILDQNFENYLIAYACKACSLLYICKYISSFGLGAEVVSDGELYIALKAGFERNKIVFDGVSKSDYEIKYALSQDIYTINCESFDEVKVISSIAEGLGMDVNIGLRVNPEIKLQTHNYLKTGTKYNKFGIDFNDAIMILDLINKIKNVKLKGFHFHLGSNIKSPEPFIVAIDKISKLIHLAFKKGYKIEYLDIGGGIPILSNKEGLHNYLFPILEFIRKKLLSNVEDLRIILEPGRSIVGDSAVLLTRVNYVKNVDKRKWILIDAGMNDLIRPALYGVFHPIECLSCVSNRIENYSIGGPICESSDVFAKDIKLPTVRRGDILAFLRVGAYGISMSSNYNSRRRPAVVVIENNNFRLIKRRENLEDLISNEIV